RAHTALKIEPHYKGATAWVKDASRAVGVAQSLLSEELREDFVAGLRRDYATIRERHRDKGDAKKLVPLAKARAQAFDGRFDGKPVNYIPPIPAKPGITVIHDQP